MFSGERAMRIHHLAGIAVASLASAAAGAATFSSQQIAIMGSTAVAAQTVSDRGVIIGTYLPPQSQPSGFILQGSSLYVLPSSYPTAINRAGEVVGFGENGGFLWQNGSFNPAVKFPINTNAETVPDVLINDRGEIAYTAGAETGQQIFAGPPTKPHAQKGLSANHAVVSSINNSGVLAGFEQAIVNGNVTPAFFIGKSGLYDILPLEQPGVAGTPAAFVNDAGSAAFVENGNVVIYANGGMTTLPAPALKATNVTVTGFNNGGRVVGTYDDGTQMPAIQRIFYYNGSTYFTFGNYPVGNMVHVALNNRNVLAVSNSTNGEGGPGMPIGSFLVTCSGKDC
jgi:hypothetical protein